MAVYPNNVYRLQFLTNHDENSWAGTIDTLMGNSQRAFAALIFTAQRVTLRTTVLHREKKLSEVKFF